jgi:hypothetical protein
MAQISPLLTFFDPNPDLSPAEIEKEFHQMVERNQALDDFLEGKLPATDVLDILEANGVDPVEYVTEVDSVLNLYLL